MAEQTSSDHGSAVLTLAQLPKLISPTSSRIERSDIALRQQLRDALFTARRHAWWPAVQEWLGRFEGLELMLVDATDLPAHQVLDVFGARMQDTDPVIAESLGRCDFLCWRAHPVNDQLERCGAAWDWRSTRLNDFMAASPYIMYQTDQENPKPTETGGWLLSRLAGSPHLVRTP